MRKGSAASVKDTRLGCYFGSVAFPIKRRPVGQRKPITFDVKGLTKKILAETLKEHVRCRLLAPNVGSRQGSNTSGVEGQADVARTSLIWRC
jgi:hypothetical protein